MVTFLVVDDNQDNLLTMFAQLKAVFTESMVLTAHSGVEGIEIALKEQPDVILLDLHMPEMDGKETCRRLKVHALTKHIPILIISAENIDLHERISVLESGAENFIQKPINTAVLEAHLRVLIRIKQAEDELTRERNRLQNLVKERSAALKQAELIYQTLFNNASDAILIHDFAGKLLHFNDELCNILDLERESLQTLDLFSIDTNAAEYLKRIRNFNGLERSSLIFETTYLDKMGNLVPMELKSRIFQLDNQPVAFTNARDISQRKKIEEDHFRLMTAINQADEAIIITDVRSNIQYVNPAFENITGYKAEEVLNKNPRFLQSGKQDKSFYREMWDVLSQGKVWRGHFINRRKDGKLFEEVATISPIFNEEGRIDSYVGVKHDVSTQKKLESKLQQAQKMEAIGTLAGGIAHDFNNILTALLGGIILALDEPGLPAKASWQLQKSLKAGDRAKNLVRQILTFSRHEEPQKQALFMDETVNEVLQLLRSSFPPDINIHINLNADGGVIMADPTQIHQVIMNLCTNAAYSMQNGIGTLTVGTDKVRITAENQMRYTINPGAYVRLMIEDTGSGMTEEVRERLFEPFFTTKPLGEGTGMGLAVVHGIIAKIGGTIQVESEVDEGTRIYIYFPMVKSQVPRPTNQPPSKLPRGSEHIMLIDDDNMVLQVEDRLLRKLGYKVTSFNDPLDALKAFEAAATEFDMVLTDHSMPHLSGIELSRKMLKVRQDIPIVMMSGFNEKLEDEKVREIGIREFLHKPVNPYQLAQSLREHLTKAVVTQSD